MFVKEQKIVDIFRDEAYYSDELHVFSSDEFSVQKVFEQYMAEVSSTLIKESNNEFVQQKRYPSQAFMEMYMSESLQQYSQSHDEYKEFNVKVKKIS